MKDSGQDAMEVQAGHAELAEVGLTDALPEGWADAMLENLGMIRSTCVDPSKEPNKKFELWSVPTFPTGRPEILTGAEIGSTKQRVQQGDVLLCKINPRINRVWVVEKGQGLDQIASSEWIVFRNGEVDPQFLKYRMRESVFRTKLCADVSGVGGSLTRARPVTVKTIGITLPPKPEQVRIVSAIESLQKRSSRAKQALLEVNPLLSQLRQSVLRDAFSGRLTERWRSENPDVEPATELLARIRTERKERWEAAELVKYEAKGKQPPQNWQDKYKEPEPVSERDIEVLPQLPPSWCWIRVGELINSIDAGRSPTAHSRPAGPDEFGVLKVSAVTWREFNPTANKALMDGDSIDDSPTPRAGDLLISRANTVELIGAVVLVKDDYPNLMLSDKTLRLNRVSDGILPKYLLYGLRSQSVRESFEANATGTSHSMRNLSQAKILGAPIALAPLDEQVEIIRSLVGASDSADRLEAVIASSKSELAQLDQSILAKAFRGELVPQDPRDEPASQLLHRIRTTREQADTKKLVAKKKPKWTNKAKSAGSARSAKIAKSASATKTRKSK